MISKAKAKMSQSKTKNHLYGNNFRNEARNETQRGQVFISKNQHRKVFAKIMLKWELHFGDYIRIPEQLVIENT